MDVVRDLKRQASVVLQHLLGSRNRSEASAHIYLSMHSGRHHPTPPSNLLCRSCVRVHKLALLAQRSFWNSLLRSDKIAFKELQVWLQPHGAEYSASEDIAVPRLSTESTLAGCDMCIRCLMMGLRGCSCRHCGKLCVLCVFLQRNLKLMEETEARATATYRRWAERILAACMNEAHDLATPSSDKSPTQCWVGGWFMLRVCATDPDL